MLFAICIIIIVTGSIILFGYFASQNLAVDYFTVEKKLTDEIVFCHLSDLHYPKYGIKTGKILDSVTEEKPDILS